MVDELDYEQKQQYELTIRATDGVFPVYAEVLVSILVQDVNDCPPEFSQDAYNISVSEAAPFGTSVLKVVTRDNDTGMYVIPYFGYCFNNFFFAMIHFVPFSKNKLERLRKERHLSDSCGALKVQRIDIFVFL